MFKPMLRISKIVYVFLIKKNTRWDDFNIIEKISDT